MANALGIFFVLLLLMGIIAFLVWVFAFGGQETLKKMFEKNKNIINSNANVNDGNGNGADEESQPEVYVYDEGRYAFTEDDVEEVAAKMNAIVATRGQLEEAQEAGAEWCHTGWIRDKPGTNQAHLTAAYPMQQVKKNCGGRAGIIDYLPPNKHAAVTLYGAKPPPGTEGIKSFAPGQWSMYD